MQLINKLKENNQDYEFYPSTNEMIKAVFENYTKDKKNYSNEIENFSMLDIGAGNSNVFKVFDELLPLPKDERYKTHIDKFAIEKSEMLITAMPDDIIIIGTDFEKQTLIDKKVDMIFCNPPYSRFKEWTLKILKESNCNIAYLIIPERWDDKVEIKSIIEKRKIKYEVIFEGDFLDSEYRQARAKINIIRFDFGVTKYGKCDNDPFDIWFEENFKINAEKEKQYFNPNDKKSKSEEIKELIKGKNIIESLEELYQKDMEKLLNTYKQLENIDYDLFKEMGVNFDNLKTALKEKISNLKILYWNELFDNLDKITNKLTSESRKKILDKLNKQTNIDFTAGNAYSLVIWVLKNANIYIDEQLKEVYFEMASPDNIKNYKSNKKFIEDGWRYSVKDHTHFKLDYRLVFVRWNCFDNTGYSSYQYPKGLYRDIHDFINDISTIANNLGFENIDSSFNFNWQAGKENIFTYTNGKEFMRIRAYKNGNIHCKINQEFMMKLNIEMARLNKWVKDETNCANELEIDIKEVHKYFGSNRKLLRSEVKLLGCNNE